MADYIEWPEASPFDAGDMHFEMTKWKNKWFSVHLMDKKGGSSKVQIVFRNVLAQRLIDGLALESEDGTNNSGIKRRALGYMVEGSQFWQYHRELLADHPGAKHYRLITIDAAIDVISGTPPAVNRLDVVS